MNPERRHTSVDREKVDYIHKKLRYLAREIETSDEVRGVFVRMYEVDTEQVVDLVKVLIYRDSRLLTVPGHTAIELEDFNEELTIQIRDMLDTMLKKSED